MKLSDIAAIFSVQSRGRGWMGLGVLALLMLAAVVVIAQVPSLLRAGNVPTDVDVQPLAGEALKARTDGFRKSTSAAADKVVARAPFYPAKPKVAPPPPTPTRYTGPAIIAMVSDTVFFADGKRLRVGGPAEEGLSVIATSAPWSALLRYNGAEFSVSLFEKDPVKLNTGLGGPTTPPGLAGGGSSSSGSITPPTTAPAPAPGTTPAAGTGPSSTPPSSTPPSNDPQNSGPREPKNPEPATPAATPPPVTPPTPPEPMPESGRGN